MTYVLDLTEIDRTRHGMAGGKAANLAELSRLDGIDVPAGFVVTTDAFRASTATAHGLGPLIDQLERSDPGDRTNLGTLSARIRRTIERAPVSDELVTAIGEAVIRFGENRAYAVRSSATAEDLPDASFAGQQDSFLNVIGVPTVVQHVRRCWASLYTDRAVTYRHRNSMGQRSVAMAVIVQRMVPAEVAGVLFTADPATSHRRVTTVDAVRGLGEALVSGRTNAESYRVRDDGPVERVTDTGARLLSDPQVHELVSLGRRIETHFGHPQDIEWCLAAGAFHVVQSRPITTLFPVPAVDDSDQHVYLSVGHQQMMTDAMTPLGLSVWQLITPRPMAEAGGRLFVDVAATLRTTAGRVNLLETFGRSDPLTTSALRSLLDRGDVIGAPTDDESSTTGESHATPAEPIPTDPGIVTDLMEQSRASVAALRRDISTLSGPALFEFILADIRGELKRHLFGPRSHQVIMAGMEAVWWLNDHVEQWLGERNVSDVLTRSVPGNVTAEMGLALLDVADAVRGQPDVVAFLRRIDLEGADGDGFLDALDRVDGGAAASAAIRAYLEQYGMRGAGEIDITRPRWSEQPASLVPTILGHVDNAGPGESVRRFEQGRQEAAAAAQPLLTRLLLLPDGRAKADETRAMIDRVRTFAGYREYPKYGMVTRTFLYKQALLAEANRLVEDGILRATHDVFFLRFEELHDVVRRRVADHELIRRRREQFAAYRALTPPRVFTSDGEVVSGTYGHRDDLPDGALAGIGVSAGTVTGRARVLHDMGQAELEPGDILVTAYTDPSWTPAFVSIAGLVTEVGSAMTHGAVIAREYGLPAVVAVENATRLIRDGQRIRLDGAAGHVEILE